MRFDLIDSRTDEVLIHGATREALLACLADQADLRHLQVVRHDPTGGATVLSGAALSAQRAGSARSL